MLTFEGQFSKVILHSGRVSPALKRQLHSPPLQQCTIKHLGSWHHSTPTRMLFFSTPRMKLRGCIRAHLIFSHACTHMHSHRVFHALWNSCLTSDPSQHKGTTCRQGNALTCELITVLISRHRFASQQAQQGGLDVLKTQQLLSGKTEEHWAASGVCDMVFPIWWRKACWCGWVRCASDMSHTSGVMKYEAETHGPCKWVLNLKFKGKKEFKGLYLYFTYSLFWHPHS